LTAVTTIRRRWREPSVLPGFGPALGFTLTFLSLIVIIPMAALAARPWEHGLSGFWAVVTDPRVLAALRVSFGVSAAAAATNVVFGLVAAWVLVRYQFPGRRLLDAMLDLPFALPTAVAGVALTTLYGPNGPFGAPLMKLGIKVAYTPLGIWVALVFVGLPFVVRSVQPVLQDFDAEVEEAAISLGAGPLQRWFGVFLPTLMPALMTGFTLAFARAVGEYGSVIFIAGNMPYKSEIVPLLIINKLEEFDYSGAAAVGVIMMAASFLALFLINFIQVRLVRRGAA
jgi:sulfate transport system permease protein